MVFHGKISDCSLFVTKGGHGNFIEVHIVVLQSIPISFHQIPAELFRKTRRAFADGVSGLFHGFYNCKYLLFI